MACRKIVDVLFFRDNIWAFIFLPAEIKIPVKLKFSAQVLSPLNMFGVIKHPCELFEHNLLFIKFSKFVEPIRALASRLRAI